MNTHPRLNSKNEQDQAFQRQLAACRASPEVALSLPPSSYRDEGVLRSEIERTFQRSWIGVGRADQVKAVGDYLALDVAGAALILLRDKAGKLRVFANACRHRGTRLVDGSGNSKRLRCPFHSWVYRLDGSLAGAPKMEQCAGFDKEACGLVEFRAEERLGFAFVCLDPSTADIDTYLGNLAEPHAPWPLESLVSARRRSMTVACNWKAFLEVFNEHYHLPFVHPDSINDLYLPPDPGDPATGAFASQFGPTEGTGGLLQDAQSAALPIMPGLEGRAANGVRYTWLFPNMTFAAGRDAIWVYEAYPLHPGHCLVKQTICFPPKTMALPDFEQRAAAYFHRLDAALDEDIPALEKQHQGLSSPHALQGPFQPLLEANVAAFAAWYAAQLSD